MITSLYQNLSKVDSLGVQIEPSERAKVKLVLKISSSIEGINEFKMDFIFTATNINSEDKALNIKIGSNS